MTAIDTMMQEHQQILKVLDALEVFANRATRDESYDKNDLFEFVTFIQDYADARHHGKEETLLFSAMVEHGFPRNSGPMAVMLHEHKEGRELISQLKQRAQSSGDVRDVARASHTFVTLLRQHIAKEDHVLYVMARERLPRGVMEYIDRQCAEHDKNPAVASALPGLLSVADRLTKRYC